jgi:hypothetical protein
LPTDDTGLQTNNDRPCVYIVLTAFETPLSLTIVAVNQTKNRLKIWRTNSKGTVTKERESALLIVHQAWSAKISNIHICVESEHEGPSPETRKTLTHAAND